MKSEKDVKKECIKRLEEVIQDIKEDDKHYNYQYIEEVLKIESDYDSVIRHVRLGIERTEKHKR